MAFRKSYTKKKTYRKKRASLRPAVRRIVTSMAEKKWKNSTYGSVGGPIAVGNTWTAVSFFGGPTDTNNIAVGNDVNTRIGNKIFVSNIEYRFTIKPTGGAGMDVTGGNQCRLAVYHNKQCNSTLVSAAQVFTRDSINAVRHPDYLRKISLKRDVIMNMTPQSSTVVGPAWPVIGMIKVNKVMDMGTSSISIGSMIKDDFGYLIIADFVTCCEYYLEWIIRYTDM